MDGTRALVRRIRRLGLASTTALVLCAVLTTDVLGLTWLSDTPATKGGTGWAYPGSLAVSSSTVAHAAYEQLVLGSWRIHYRRTTNGGATWGTPIVLSRQGIGTAGVPVIDASGSAVDAVWIEGDDIIAGTDTVVAYRRSADSGATWLPAVRLSPLFEAAGYPHVARQGARVVVAWTNENDGRVYVRISNDGGATFAARIALATTTDKPFGGTILEAFPTIALGSGVIYVGFYTASKTLKLRRSTDGGLTWKTAQTLASDASGGWKASLAASGSTVLAGYARRTSSDEYSAVRRSTDKGATFGSVVALSPASAAYSFQPVLTYRGGFRAIYERCATNSCSTSAVYYRSSSTGASWSSAVTASVRKRSYGTPADVDVAGKVLIMYVDSNSSAGDVYIRRGS
jgi:hypothetical protein